MITKNETPQKDTFLESEGDNYFERSKGIPQESRFDILPMVKASGIKITNMLEVGCSDGWRLNEFSKIYPGDFYGIDPSTKAINEGCKKYPWLSLHIGTADVIPSTAGSFDAILMGFCLYLCDRGDLFKIASEVDRCLIDGGHIIILDFFPKERYEVPYCHLKGLKSYHFDHAQLWDWNPKYLEVTRIIGEDEIGVVILKKAMENPL